MLTATLDAFPMPVLPDMFVIARISSAIKSEIMIRVCNGSPYGGYSTDI